MNKLKLNVHAVEQSCSWGQHITVYDAEVELITGESSIEVEHIQVVSSMPMEADPEDLEAACRAILQGVTEVLAPRGLGAHLKVTRLLLHPVDFRAEQFRIQTVRALSQLLAERDSG